MHPKGLSIKDFTYELPAGQIARYPLPERDLSKLLIYKDGHIGEDIYRNITAYLPENSLLVFNNTRVVQARLLFTTTTGAKVEVFCLEPALNRNGALSSMSHTQTVRWKCMVGRASKWKEKILDKKGDEFAMQAEIVARDADSFIIEFNWLPEEMSFAEVLSKAGIMPIPPYLARESEEVDRTRYQTVYALHEGSVAAPTAGLHFTDSVFESLGMKNIRQQYVTLHVGAGTFKPVKSETMQEHDMHSEWIQVSTETIQAIIESLPQSIITVGTTSLRTIETLYWMGVKAHQHPTASINELEVGQWDAYDIQPIPTIEALQTLQAWMARNEQTTLFCKTQIMIAPGYLLRIADGIVTNFHQPNSTLLLLVAALLGDDWRKVYDYALANQFRFLSYGDGSLLFANKKAPRV